MKNIYETPMLELIRFASADVITASDDTAEDGFGSVGGFDEDGDPITNA